MKILFSNLPWWENINGKLRQGIRAGSRWPFTKAAAHYPGEFRFGGYLPYPFFLGHAAGYTKKLLPESDVVVRDSVARGETYADFGLFLKDYNPDYIVVETATPSWEHDQMVIRKMIAPLGIQVILCGTLPETSHASILSEFPCVKAILRGEYDKNVTTAILGARGVYNHDLLTAQEMKDPPFPIWDEKCLTNYWDACPSGQKAPQLQMWTSRGCFHKCLSGDTPVNTVGGLVPIKDLVGMDGVGVYTYDPITKNAFVATAKNIRQYGVDSLVRVHFDDGSHIDCTPDHQFLAFRWGNQFTGEKEWRCEAKDLKPGMHLRAIKPSMSGEYMQMSWARRKANKTHRMVAEWFHGRKIQADEIVHHIDKNKLNNSPENLQIIKQTDHFDHHPEVSERMRLNNPTKNGMSEDWINKIKLKNSGKVRSAEAKERYRAAAKIREAKKSAEQKRADAERMAEGRKGKDFWSHRPRNESGQFLDNGIINHRVVSVERLEGEHPVYCLEIPETGWFYANNVLVKNCVFCVWPAVMTGNDPDGTKNRTVRFHSPEWVESYIRHMLTLADYKVVLIDDDTFNLSQKHTRAICEVMKRIGIPWSAMCRADTVDSDTWKMMKDSGCFGVKIGFESGSQYVIDHIVNKKLDIQRARETCRWLQKEVGIKVHTTWTVGLPGETPEQRRETVALIESMYLDGSHTTHQLSGTATIDGTPLDHIAKGEKLEKYDGATSEGFVVSPDGQLKVEGMK